MITSLNNIWKNRDGRQLFQVGTPLFPCSAYQCDIHDYISGYVAPHWHPEMEIFYLEEGCVTLSLIDREVKLKAGDGYFVNVNVLHGIVCNSDGPCRYRSMVFDPALVAGASGSAFDTLYLRPFMEEGASFYQLSDALIASYFHDAFHACETEVYGYEFMVREALSHILLILKNNQITFKKPLYQQEQRMKQMLSWIDLHYHENFSVEEIASIGGISVRECQRSFASFLHVSPMRYVLKYRIEKAAELLLTQDLSITEIAYQCGFDSSSYFSKQFKELMKMTPRQFKQKHF